MRGAVKGVSVLEESTQQGKDREENQDGKGGTNGEEKPNTGYRYTKTFRSVLNDDVNR